MKGVGILSSRRLAFAGLLATAASVGCSSEALPTQLVDLNRLAETDQLAPIDLASDAAVPVDLATHCTNGLKDGDETDVDCGGGCPKTCADGLACKASSDCASDLCTHRVCLPAVCKTTCGGTSCPKCNDSPCTSNIECISDSCVDNVCTLFFAYAPCSTGDDYPPIVKVSPTVSFPVAGNQYAPKCLSVKVGATVTFTATTGTFADHPLTGSNRGAAANPIAQPANPTVTTHAVTFPLPGFFPYYCALHGDDAGNGMAGVIQAR